MKVAVVVCPGSNCDADVAHAVEVTIGASVEMVWHARESLPAGTDLVILPGGPQSLFLPTRRAPWNHRN
ncbi:hypothetical protein [Acetomicrobium sp. S15 = DSM 107314]|uniref:hypothetical protein n=1 Tax=Acetomicrobium sp. S15 = DSM 107314 TaxID=2529858 RepID=UPI0018E17E49|nr:hypothetical protein [Acetomicrobium sp. S15 = DSM 107314]